MSLSGGNTFPIALLGRRDQPTDAVRDYCEGLAQGLARRDIRLGIEEVPWEVEGILASLVRFWRRTHGWRERWVLVQYTALSWSRRGFPLMFLVVLWILRVRKTHVAVIFHDPVPFSGSRLVDQARRLFQGWVMSCAYRVADSSILTIPLEHVSWAPTTFSKATFIPVGSNVPPVVRSAFGGHGDKGRTKTVAVFSMTDDGSPPEIEDIVFVVTRIGEQVERPRLVTLGRGSERAEKDLRQKLRGVQAEFISLGLLSPDDVSKTLAAADLLLFARGKLTTQRGSAIAGIACGLPIVAYCDSNVATSLMEAGVLPVPFRDREELSRAVTRVLIDDQLREELHKRSVRAQEKYFSWDAIADKFMRILSHGSR